MIKGYDCAFPPRPDPKSMYANGFRVVWRYVFAGTADKQLTQAEAAQLHAAGLFIAFAVEGAATDDLLGYGTGADYTVGALGAIHALTGMNARMFAQWHAYDQDVTSANLAGAVKYGQGVHDAMGGPELAGCYGDVDIITALHDNGYADNFWLTMATAWSHGQSVPYLSATQVESFGSYDLDYMPQLPRGLWAPDGTITTGREQLMRYQPLGLPGTPDGLDGRVHITDGQFFRVQPLSFQLDNLQTAAGNGPVVQVRPADLPANYTYVQAIAQLCGEPHPTQSGLPSSVVLQFSGTATVAPAGS